MTNHTLALYNPALLPPDILLAEFTARRHLLSTILDIIRSNSPTEPQQHCLLIGARGMGKTTTLWAIAHSVNRDTKLATLWQPIVFDEESRRVGDLADFWLEAIRQWEHATHDSANRADRLLRESPIDFESNAQAAFLRLVDASGKRALLLVDNLNELLGAIHDAQPLHRLRAFLMHEPRVMIIGGATRYFDEITSVDQPFYDFFRYFELRPLSLEDMQACLLSLARTRGNELVQKTLNKRRGSIRALHLLTGGNPRLIKTFYRLLADGLRGDIRVDLEKLLDEFTPYFKAVVDALPNQQQRIFDAVALAWDPIEAGAIARTTRIASNQVSAQLRALVKAGLLVETAGTPKRKSYMVADRFSNIHYLMRHGRAARNRFDWFVALVRLVFPDREAVKVLVRVAQQAAICGPDGERDARAMVQSALNRAETKESRQAFLHETLRKNWDQETLLSLDHWFDTERAKIDLPEVEIVAFFKEMPTALRKKLGYAPDKGLWWYSLTDFLEEKSAWILAEAAYRKAIELEPNQAFPWIGLGCLYRSFLNRDTDAELCFRRAVELKPNSVYAWYNLGIVLSDRETPSHEAEHALRKAIDIAPRFSKAWARLGLLLERASEKRTEAEAAYRKSIELDPKDPWAWVRLGLLLQGSTNNNAEAEASLRKAIELDPKDPAIRVTLGNLLRQDTNRHAEAEAQYRTALDLDGADSGAWFCLGRVLQLQGKIGDAESAFRKAISVDRDEAFSLVFLADILSEKSTDLKEATELSIRALMLRPDVMYCRYLFLKLSKESVSSWETVLPSVIAYCVKPPRASGAEEVFKFAVDGLLQLSLLAGAQRAIVFADSLPDISPFETVIDSLRVAQNKEYALTLAPEKQNLATELLGRRDHLFSEMDPK